jgi:hypothetical protein
MLDFRWLEDRSVDIIQHQLSGIGPSKHFASLNGEESVSI